MWCESMRVRVYEMLFVHQVLFTFTHTYTHIQHSITLFLSHTHSTTHYHHTHPYSLSLSLSLTHTHTHTHHHTQTHLSDITQHRPDNKASVHHVAITTRTKQRVALGSREIEEVGALVSCDLVVMGGVCRVVVCCAEGDL
jgi:hypothetical protein